MGERSNGTVLRDVRRDPIKKGLVCYVWEFGVVLKIVRNHFRIISRESNKDLSFQKSHMLMVLNV